MARCNVRDDWFTANCVPNGTGQNLAHKERLSFPVTYVIAVPLVMFSLCMWKTSLPTAVASHRWDSFHGPVSHKWCAPCTEVFHEKLTVAQRVTFPEFYINRDFITIFTRICNFILSRASGIQSPPTETLYIRYNGIIWSNFLHFPTSLFP